MKVFVKKHPTITRNGIDAHSVHEISIVDAVLGCEIGIPTIYGEVKTTSVPAGSQSGDQIKLMKQGFQRVNSQMKGNHIATLKLKVPKKVSEEERRLYEQLKEMEKSANTKVV